MRVWLPDRPGALGAVASRVGAVGGDVVGIEVVEREGGVAVDDLVVDLPRDGLAEIMFNEVRQVDGVRIEDVHVDSSAPEDPARAAFLVSVALMVAADPKELAQACVSQVRRLVGAEWVCLLDSDGTGIAAEGRPPPDSWLAAFRDGLRGGTGPPDPVCAHLPASGADLIVGRPSRPLRSREKGRVTGVAALASARWTELARASSDEVRASVLAHPARRPR